MVGLAAPLVSLALTALGVGMNSALPVAPIRAVHPCPLAAVSARACLAMVDPPAPDAPQTPFQQVAAKTTVLLAQSTVRALQELMTPQLVVRSMDAAVQCHMKSHCSWL